MPAAGSAGVVHHHTGMLMEQTQELGTIGYLWAAILGVIQGLSEFLPVSSSGHLALAEHLGMGVAAPPTFDVFLHLATLVVVLVYFRAAIVWYLRNDIKVLFYVVAASVPTGIIGFTCKKYFEALRHSPTMICIGLLVTACFLSVAELRRGSGYQLRDLGWFGAVVIGFCQSLALAPGISRSGMTISGAMICGSDREEAFRFSFILSIPAVTGAVLLHVLELARAGGLAGFLENVAIGPFALGFGLAVVTGFIALAVLERLVAGGRLVWFAAYCCLVALGGLVYFNLFAR